MKETEKEDLRKYNGQEKKVLSMSLWKVLDNFFNFYGIDKCSLPFSNYSNIEIRQMMLKLARICYGLGLQDSNILNKSFLFDEKEFRKKYEHEKN